MFIPDPESEFFHPGSRAKEIQDPDPQRWSEVPDLDMGTDPDSSIIKQK
jgi:hypothetical protein